MFEFLLAYDNDAIGIILKDHEKVKDLFDRFEQTDNRRERISIARQTLLELKIHTVIEEEIFYPAVRGELEEDIMHEADEEHHVARILVAELEAMDGSEPNFDAKYKVLSENVRHHIREEERDMLPRVKSLGLDFDALGEALETRKKELMSQGFPVSLEEEMVEGADKRNTPAKNARRGSASPAMMKAKSRKAPAKRGMGKTARPKASAGRKPKLKIVSHRSASSAKAARKKPASKTKR